MKKIKFQGGITKLVATKIGSFNKNNFAQYISDIVAFKQLAADLCNDIKIDIEAVSFSSSYDFNEQVLSILSFIKYVGLPASWTIYSDGTHNSEQINRLESAFPFLKVVKINFDHSYVHENIKSSLLPYQESLISYVSTFPLGKKLFLYLNFPINKPTIFLDSDVLFYQKSSCLRSIVNNGSSSIDGWFLPDAEWGTLDSRYISNNAPQHYQVNSGLFIVNKEIADLSVGLEFLKSLHGKYEYFSEQTIIHILLLENNFVPLDPRIFIVNSGDQFDFEYLNVRQDIAARHYTSPVRHKMWQRNWKWHLSL